MAVDQAAENGVVRNRKRTLKPLAREASTMVTVVASEDGAVVVDVDEAVSEDEVLLLTVATVNLLEREVATAETVAATYNYDV